MTTVSCAELLKLHGNIVQTNDNLVGIWWEEPIRSDTKINHKITFFSKLYKLFP